MSQSFPTAGQIAQRENTAAANLALGELQKPAPSRACLVLVPSLPETPKGWTRNMVMHMNMGRAGHSGVYEVVDAAGNKTPIGYQYHTKDTRLCGFTLPDVEGVMSWAALREAWPAWVESHGKAVPA